MKTTKKKKASKAAESAVLVLRTSDKKAPRQRKADGRGHFFAVDARTWGHVCAQGMAPACAYLVLARFSGGDNATTKASVQAIEKHTAISRRHARAALDALVAAKAIEQSTTPRGFPLYKLRAWREVSPTPVAESDAPQWVWLPNQLVTGTTAGEVPPVERVRQTGDVGALRLLVDLYNAHDLAGDWGHATAGAYGHATAGDWGTISIRWWDAAAERGRVATGYVGENGIEADTAYKLDDKGRFVKATP